MNRKDKIDFLKGLSNGTKSIQDLQPKELIWFPGNGEDETLYFINGVQVTVSEFEQAKKPKGCFYVIEPWADNEFEYITEFGAELYRQCRHNSPCFAFVLLVD